RKPQSPFRSTVTAQRPFVRLIGRNHLEQTAPWLAEWAQQVGQWIHEGLRPSVFIHTPDDKYAPDMARHFHVELQRHLPEIPDLPLFPIDSSPQQKFLF
ncbi:MAG: DUF72 domain-containing protein, partial [Planctomycetota bacterium]|nr:DUF72 domain-containing protein [Planctomycetota bacterium]